jgi:hypothetical protein
MLKSTPPLPSAANRLTKDKLRQLAGPGLRTFFNVARAWELTELEQARFLGLESIETLRLWRSQPEQDIGAEALTRISYLLGIYKALHTLFDDPARADHWIQTPNQASMFGGRRPAEAMCDEGLEGLRSLRTYLDAQVH